MYFIILSIASILLDISSVVSVISMIIVEFVRLLLNSISLCLINIFLIAFVLNFSNNTKLKFTVYLMLSSKEFFRRLGFCGEGRSIWCEVEGSEELSLLIIRIFLIFDIGTIDVSRSLWITKLLHHMLL